MRGTDFKIIRRANKISAIEIAEKMGFKSKTPIMNAESKVRIPSKFVETLYKMLKLSFKNRNEESAYVQECAMTMTSNEELAEVKWNFPSTRWGHLAAYGKERSNKPITKEN